MPEVYYLIDISKQFLVYVQCFIGGLLQVRKVISNTYLFGDKKSMFLKTDIFECTSNKMHTDEDT